MLTCSHRIRAALEGKVSCDELAAFLDDYASCVTPDIVLQIENELQDLHRDIGHDLSPRESQIFLVVLYHLKDVLPTPSIINLWFDLVLRPALRQPHLPLPALEEASDLIMLALEPCAVQYDEVEEQKCVLSRQSTFLRRLVDLYLWDAFNDGTDDVIAKAELSSIDREKKERWKSNLQKILLKHGIRRPEALLDELHSQFSTPSSRLQILIFLTVFSQMPDFKASALTLASHPLMSRLLLSLLIDNSSTVCDIGMTLLVQLLPVFAVHASNILKEIIAELLVILARMVCWRERGLPPDDSDAFIWSVENGNTKPPLDPKPELEWERLEATFYAAAPSPPSSKTYFTFLYYLFPCNLLRFLRTPLIFIRECELSTPFTIPWEDVIDEKELKEKTENLLRAHQCHPLIIWRDAADERSLRNFWATYDAARITSEAMLLDSTNMALAIRARVAERRSPDPSAHSTEAETAYGDDANSIQIVDSSSVIPQISLQDMLNVSVALKGNLNVEIINPTVQWPTSMFAHSTQDTSRHASIISSHSSEELPPHIAQAIASLQREVVLLRNELNFEIWLSRENVQHIGRLYQERVIANSVEVERQGLYNKLRNYRTQVGALENELKEHKRQATSAKNKYMEYNQELQNKVAKLREEKKQWSSEAAALRIEANQAKALYEGQDALLVDANSRVFEFETKRKETQHKIDRLRDYERQIEQHIKIQELYDTEFRTFEQQKIEIADMKAEMQQMWLQMESYVAAQSSLEEELGESQREVHLMQSRLDDNARKKKGADASKLLDTMVEDKKKLQRTNEELYQRTVDQNRLIDELQAALEVLQEEKL